MPRILNPFFIGTSFPSGSPQTGSVDMITMFHATSSFSNSISSGTIASIGIDITDTKASIGSTGELYFKVADADNTFTTGSKLLTLAFSGSDNEARVGIGFRGDEKPIRPLDIKSATDTTQGSELLLRSARKLKGGEIGDSAGKIDFVIDSASYNDIEISGSIATIESFIDTIDESGTTGELVFSVAATKEEVPLQRLKIGSNNTTEITGSVSMSLNLDVGNDLVVDRSASLEHLVVGQGEYPSLRVYHGGSDSSITDKYVFARKLYAGVSFAGGYSNTVDFAVGPGDTFITSNVIYLGNASSDVVFVSGTLHASLSFDDAPVTSGVVVYDTGSKRLYYTSSFVSTGSQGPIGQQGVSGIQGDQGNPGVGVQGPQGPSGIPTTDISASGFISASSGNIENSFIIGADLSIGGISNVSSSIAAAAGGGSTPTLQEVTNAGSITTTAITASIISSSGALTASNLSGNNTGDQDLSSYIQNSQTSSMSVATASFVDSIHGGTF